MRSFTKVLLQLFIVPVLLLQQLYPQFQASQSNHTAPWNSWQEEATGLGIFDDSDDRTAGLSFMVKADEWPRLSTQGGVYIDWDYTYGPTGIDLGMVKTSSSGTAVLTDQKYNWSKNEMIFSPQEGQTLKLVASRLTPSLLIETESNQLTLFHGTVPKVKPVYGPPSQETGVISPRYVAFSQQNQPVVKMLGSTKLSTGTMDKNWLLVWLGQNSHFVESKLPHSDSAMKSSDSYQADIPFLIVFQNNPESIRQAVGGGLELIFPDGNKAGRLAMMPLYGRDHLMASQTETWSSGLPEGAVQDIRLWADRMCEFPVDVREDYAYSLEDDTVSITENITYVKVCNSGGIQFAPIPPALALAYKQLEIRFSKELINTGIATEFGPYLGFDNSDQYTWSFSGLDQYVKPIKREPSKETEAAELIDELKEQVKRLIASGPMDPWIFADDIPSYDYRGDIYWLNPAESLIHMAAAVEALPAGNTRDQLITYMRNERLEYPPETTFNRSFNQGSRRLPFSIIPTEEVLYRWQSSHQDVAQQRVTLYNYYALSRYYEVTGEPFTQDVLQSAQTVLDSDMREQDWATMYWFKSFQDRRVSVVNANRHFAGLVGYIRIADLAKDHESGALGRALLLKAAVSRTAMLHYPRFLEEADLIHIPTDPAWHVKATNDAIWLGVIFDYNWTSAQDDSRQVVTLNEFGVRLYGHSGFMETWWESDDWDKGPSSAFLVAYRDMQPELGYFLRKTSLKEARIYLEKVTRLVPDWYAAYSEARFGIEHNLNHPIDSFQLFMASTYFSNPGVETLGKYADIPWLESGDLFYIQKLAEAVLTDQTY